MTSITKTNQTVESQTIQMASLPEGPIRTISHEILEFILVFTNQSDKTRLVSHVWKDLTFTAVKNSKKQELKLTIRLISEKFHTDKYARFYQKDPSQCIADLAELQDAHQSLSDHVATLAEVQRLFLIVKGLVIGVLREIPKAERSEIKGSQKAASDHLRFQLKKAIGDQLPNSMKNLFKIFKLDFLTKNLMGNTKLDLKNIDQDTFLTLLQSWQPLSTEDRGEAVFCASLINNIDFVKLLLADGPISEERRGRAAWKAAEYDNSEFVKLLLANGPISVELRGDAVGDAAENDNVNLVKELLTTGPISHEDLGWTLKVAAKNKNPELIKLLLTAGPISRFYRTQAAREVNENSNPELVQLLLREPIRLSSLKNLGQFRLTKQQFRKPPIL